MSSRVMLSVAAASGLSWAFYAAADWRRTGQRLDFLFALSTCCWTMLLAWALLVQHVETPPTRLGAGLLQLALLTAEAFLLMAAGRWRQRDRVWLTGHGLLVASWVAVCLVVSPASVSSDQAALAWVWINVAFVVLLLLMLTRHAWRVGNGRAWAALMVAPPVCLALLHEMQRSVAGSAPQSIFVLLVGPELFLLWLALRSDTRQRLADAEAASQMHGQLAQDLHDGVGYHLTSIIAALDHGTSQQRATAAALQECLLELKLLVDGTNTEGSVLGHLANLRYRTQPLLDAAGIDMRWEIEQTDALDQLQGDAAMQVLRVAQEALANVIRHSGARSVTVRCVVAPSELMLEILDDGRGLPRRNSTERPHSPDAIAGTRAHTRGHGLRGMRARAERLGGRLRIDSIPGQGTRVQLRVPVQWGEHA